MRDPERIPTLLADLERLWSDFPDMRFGQLVSNLLRTRYPVTPTSDDTACERNLGVDLWFLEDYEWDAALVDLRRLLEGDYS